ncbi:hypothetical protein M9458_032582, partial [Cirrhinus mrigala]
FCLVSLPCLFCYFGLLTGILMFCLFFWITLLFCPGYYCLLEIDLACLEYDLYNKAHTWIYSRFQRVPLQNTLPPRDPAAFGHRSTMDPASRLVQLRQGNRPIEQYIMDFCELCHLVDFKESFLKDIFYFGLCKDISSKMPGHHRHWSLVRCIDFALLLSSSAFTVGITDDKPCHPPVSATPKSLHVMSGIVTIMPEPPHAKPAKPRSAKVMSSKPEPSHAKPAKPKPAQVMSTKPQPAHVTSAAPGPAHVTSAAPGPAHAMPVAPRPAHVMATLPESAPVMAALPESTPVMAAISKPVHKMAAIPEPVHKMAAIPEPVHKMAAITEPVYKMATPSESLAKMAANLIPSYLPYPKQV